MASLVCGGGSNKEVAAKLGKSVLTVKAQLQSIYGKLGIVGRGRLISQMREREREGRGAGLSFTVNRTRGAAAK